MLICVTILLRTVATKIKCFVRCILDRQCIGRLSLIECACNTHTTNILIYSLTLGACNEDVHMHRNTLCDITQTLMCFDDCSGVCVIEEASTTKVQS